MNKRPLVLSQQKLALLKKLRDQKIGGAGTPAESEAASPISPARRAHQDTFPLSKEQQQLWFDAQLAFGDSTHHLSASWRFNSLLNQAYVRQGLEELMQRHQMLQCVFTNDRGEPQLQWQPALSLAFKVINLDHLDATECEHQLTIQLHQEEEQPFDLLHGPLWRASLFFIDSASSILQLTLHPLIADHASSDILVNELAQLYHGYKHRGESAQDMRTPEHGPAAPQYADFTTRQSAWFESPAYRDQRSFWQEQLAALPPPVELPLQIHSLSSSLQSFSTSYELALSPDLASALDRYCAQERCTASMLLQATWTALLYRYSAQQDIIIGHYLHRRQNPDTAAMVGPLATFLPTRYQLSERLTVRELVEQVRNKHNLTLANQTIPLEQILTLISPGEQASLLRFTFSSIHSSGASELFSGVASEPVTSSPPICSCSSLSLCVREEMQRYELSIVSASACFSAATIKQVLTHYLALFQHFVAHPEQSILRGEFLTPKERQQLLTFTNHTASLAEHHAPPHHLVHQLFEQRVRKTPTAIALIAEGGQLTYSELDARANQLAHLLLEQGLQLEQPVGIALERSLDLIVSMLAILKAGGAYVPLDPTLPSQRLSFYLQDAHIELLLTHSNLLAGFPSFDGTVLCLDLLHQQLSQSEEQAPERPITPANLAYIIYTSGSTGQPKGVMNTHAGICNRLLWMREQYRLGSHEHWLQKTPFSFDVSVAEIFCSLISGARLVLARPEGQKDPAYLVQLIQRAQISTVHFVPSMLRFFLEEPGVEACSSLVRVMCSGEALTPELQEQCFARLPGVELHNLYGPTEAAVEVSFWDCQRGGAPGQVVPIGRPLSQVSLYVLDEQVQLVPPGVEGDLYIGGVQVARGYVGAAERTAEAFLPDPFAEGGRLYRTGDRARLRPDGVIEYLGRRDHQVKIGGHRIELSEIETVMQQHPLVQQAVAVMRDTPSQQKQLVAYLIPDNTEDATPDSDSTARYVIAQLRSYLHSQLPEYMVPSAFVVLSTFPLTPSGKLDKLSLPAPTIEHLRLNTSQHFKAPRSHIEHVLTDIATEVLHLSQVGIDDNLFELGANSLNALQLAVRLRQQLQINITLKEIFQYPTISGLSALAERQGQRAIATSVSTNHISAHPLTPVPRDQELPLSFAQQRLWFLDQLYPGQTSYIIPLVLRLLGLLHVQALRQSLQEIIWRHEILRTTIQSNAGQPVQHIQSTLRVPLLLHDLSSLSEQERERRIHDWTEQETHTPFDLVRGPLLRLRLLRVQAQEHVLFVTMHHIVSDGWSISLMWQELIALYTAFSSGKASPLTPLTIQYADFAVWQRRWLQGEIREQQLAYWQQHLQGYPTSLQLPLDHERPAFQTFQGGITYFSLVPTLVERLRAMSLAHQSTLFMVLLAAFNVLLVSTTDQTDLVVGTPVANRNSVEVESLIGFFVNTLALRTNLLGNPTFIEILRRVKETTLGGYEHQDIPFEQVVERVQNARDTSRSPLFQVFFTLQNMLLATMELSDLHIEPVSSNYQVAKFDLTLGFNEAGDVLVGAFEYNAMLFEPETILALQQRLVRLLELVVEQPTLPLDALLAVLSAPDESQK